MVKNRFYRTLRGLLGDDERADDVYFACSATLRIFGQELDIEGITAELGIEPSEGHPFKKLL